MGINATIINNLFYSLKKVNWSLDCNINSLELGNLYLRNCDEKLKELDLKIVKNGDEFLRNIGFKETVRIDLNGKNRSIKLNLSKNIEVDNQFNLVLDGGTSEHIKDQYYCMKNIYNFCKVDGFVYHCLPPKGYWKRHGYFKYSPKFFKKLAKLCGYKILINKIMDHPILVESHKQLHVSMIKTTNKSFITKQQFEKIPGLFGGKKKKIKVRGE